CCGRGNAAPRRGCDRSPERVRDRIGALVSGASRPRTRCVRATPRHPTSIRPGGGPVPRPTRSRAMSTTFHTVDVDGLSVFYRQAGPPAAPKLLLLGGFPSSSHQFRNLMPALADQFHLVAFDYPGFGNTDMPDPATWDYTFDHLADVVEGALT